MSRLGTTPEFVALLDAAHVTGFFLLDIALDSGTLHLSSLPFETQWGGTTYAGLGGIASMREIGETASSAKGLECTLPLAGQAAIAAALTEPVQGRKASLMFAVIDHATQPPTLHVDSVWKGTGDTRRLNGLYTSKPELVITFEHQALAQEVPRMLRYSDADHRRRYPDDGFFKHVDNLGTGRWPARSWFEAHS